MDIKMATGNPKSVKIVKVVEENAHDRTIYFEDEDRSFAPGQFLMVWLSKIDEIPLSISFFRKGLIGLTIRPIGPATEALVSLSQDDWIGIRGPFGHPFTLDSQKPLVVGGGIGMAPLRSLIHQFVDLGIKTNVIVGARTKSDLLFVSEMQQLDTNGVSLTVMTDDGSAGIKGLVTEGVIHQLSVFHPDTIYTCGPEPMMYALWQMIHSYSIRFQASLERYMKCGCGLCGTCSLDPTGALVCKDGPVFSEVQLAKFSEFGNYYRDSTGVRQMF